MGNGDLAWRTIRFRFEHVIPAMLRFGSQKIWVVTTLRFAIFRLRLGFMIQIVARLGTQKMRDETISRAT